MRRIPPNPRLGAIRTKTELLNSSQDNYQQANASLSSLNQSFTQRTTSHKELVQEYNKELEILGECIEALNAGGVKRT